MPLHSFPHFVNTEAIRASKIDDAVQAIAAMLNGGLDATSLAAGVTFALSQFWEGYSVCPVYVGQGLGDRASAGAVVPLAGYIIGVSAAPQQSVPADRLLVVIRGVTTIYTVPVRVRGDSRKGRRAFDMLETPVAVAAGDRISVALENVIIGGVSTEDNRGTVLFAFPHQA